MTNPLKTTRRNLGEKVNDFLTSDMFYTNFYWVADWIMTGLCNLACTYCSREDIKTENIDYWQSLERIKKIKPKALWVTGNGEPTLVSDLPGLLAEAKSSWNPYITMVNNGTNTRRVFRVLPHLDQLAVSVDGIGNVNVETRGLDGDKVVQHIRAIHQRIQSDGLPVQLVTNTVVTTENFKWANEFIRTVNGISPDIVMFMSPLLPLDSPMSVVSSEETHNRFSDWLRDTENSYNVISHFGHFENGFQPEIVCHHQYFRTVIDYHGKLHPCKPQLPWNYHMMNMRQMVKQKRFVDTGKEAAKMFNTLVTNRHNPVCHTPCNCHSYLDWFFRGQDHPMWRVYGNVYKERFTKKEIDKAYRFIVKRINPEFPYEKLMPLLKP
ncbi:MAG: radical SAM protein, partial [Chloroflexi bacterium]